jgi:hypothetical protein
VRYGSYDSWKLATPWDDWQPECCHCDDEGCLECCETTSMTLDDLEERDEIELQNVGDVVC